MLSSLSTISANVNKGSKKIYQIWIIVDFDMENTGFLILPGSFLFWLFFN